ncbi:MAG: hypothetical protein R2828_26060 [Saprospiraceae bacterium]
MMKYLLLSFLVMDLVGCNGELKLQQDDIEILEYYIVSHRRNSITSSDFVQFPVEENDSLTVLPGWWTKEGESMDREEVFEFKLPNTKDKPQIFNKNCGVYLLDKRSITVNNDKYVIYKYANRSCDIDGSGNWFYVPEIGLLVIYSVTWGNLEVMTNHPKFEPELIYYLTTNILTDEDFLKIHD